MRGKIRKEYKNFEYFPLIFPGKFNCKSLKGYYFGNCICFDFDYKMVIMFMFYNNFTEYIEISMKIYFKLIRNMYDLLISILKINNAI